MVHIGWDNRRQRPAPGRARDLNVDLTRVSDWSRHPVPFVLQGSGDHDEYLAAYFAASLRGRTR